MRRLSIAQWLRSRQCLATELRYACFVALMRVMRLSLVNLCILRYAARAHTTSLYHGTSKYRRYHGSDRSGGAPGT